MYDLNYMHSEILYVIRSFGRYLRDSKFESLKLSNHKDCYREQNNLCSDIGDLIFWRSLVCLTPILWMFTYNGHPNSRNDCKYLCQLVAYSKSF
jgi:hypothetical protein